MKDRERVEKTDGYEREKRLRERERERERKKKKCCKGRKACTEEELQRLDKEQ